MFLGELFFTGNAQFRLLCKPQKPSAKMIILRKYKKNAVTKNVIVCFNNLDEENIQK